MKKYKMETWVGLFMTIGLICVVYLAVHLGDVALLGRNTYPLEARFSRVSALREGNSVTMMGIDIGQVTRVRIDQERMQAVVEFRVRDAITIYDDAMASIRTRGLIGENYLEIDAGGAGEPLRPGETIIETESPVDLVELIGRYAFGAFGDGGQ